MKILLFIFIFILAGCESQVDTPSDYIVDTNEKEEAVYILTEHSWTDAYFYALNKNWPATSILLVDVDFDGVPEIFFVWHGMATNMEIDSGLSYQNGEVVNIEFYGEWGGIPTEFSLLQSRLTGERVWLVSGRFSSGAGVFQYWVYEFVDFSDFSQVTSNEVLAYDSEMILNEEGTFGIGSIYSLHLPDNQVIDVPYEKIEERRRELFDGFEIIDVPILLVHFSRVFDNYNDWQNKTLNRDKLISVFNEWTGNKAIP
jgi:hypothetical protein